MPSKLAKDRSLLYQSLHMRLAALNGWARCCCRSIVAFWLLASVMAAAAAGLLQLDHDVAVQHKPYHQHLRQRVIALRYSQVPHLSAKQISAVLGGKPCATTCHNIITQYLIDGSTSLNGSRGILHADRKANQVAKELLLDLVTSGQDALLQELAEKMEQLTNVSWTVPEISKMLHEMGFVRVRVTQNAKEANAATQAKWRDLIQSLCVGPQHLVFVDEVAADSKVVNRHYAWVLKGLKTTCETLFVRGKRFTSIAAMSADGLLGQPLIIEGAADAEIFVEYLVTGVLPQMGRFPHERRCILVMDNCAIHNKSIIEQLCQSVGAIALFLPPYSPQYNPIEQVFGKVKAYLRNARQFVASVPPVAAIISAFATITPADCEAWIRGVACYNTSFTPL